ncbi:hypothetical protein [Fluviispira vulneris]|uniref:hypothetical protein n=1 Tax=Fluviispira vulneris TaxID=2763012 RepID=UPI00164818B7|nr:hypothetical protein [Fluviispira vulneris]
MKNTVILILFFLFTPPSHSQVKDHSHLCDYFELDTFLFDYQTISADNSDNSGESYQIFTGRPAVNFCFASQNFIFRPSISINVYENSTNGSFSVGKLLNKSNEFGIFLSLNRREESSGNGSSVYKLISSNFLIGPYLKIFHTLLEDNDLEFTTRISYLYYDQRTTTNGANTLITEQKGISLYFEELYAKKLSSHLFLIPHVSIYYAYTYDSVGVASGRNIVDFKIFPLSLRWIF